MGLLGDIADLGKGVIDENLKWAERAVTVGGQIVEFGQAAAGFLDSQAGQFLVRAAQSPILAAGQQTIESMKRSTGDGDPENGQRFGEGAAQMGAVGQVLASAFPDDSWDSGGAGAYTGRNSEQVGRVQTILGLDNAVAGVLSTEAGQISAARAGLDGHSDWLGSMGLLTTTAGVIPGFGGAARMSAEFAMVAKAVGDSHRDLDTLRGQIDENAVVLQRAAGEYASLADGAELTEAEFAPPDDAAGEEPGTSEHDDASEPATDGPAGAGGAPAAGGVPSGGGSPAGAGGTPSGMGAGAVPTSAASMPSNPTGAGSPSPDAASQVAGALGGILGSLVSPLGGILGGVLQAVGQASQAATQAAGQASQLAGGPAGGGAAADAAQIDPASGDLAADPEDLDGDGRPDEDADEDDTDRDEKSDGDDEDDQAEHDQPGAAPLAGAAGVPDQPSAGAPGGEAAKTLPPDLDGMAAGTGAAGLAPAHVGADFEHGQLRMAAAATLDRGVPGSAAVIDR